MWHLRNNHIFHGHRLLLFTSARLHEKVGVDQTALGWLDHSHLGSHVSIRWIVRDDWRCLLLLLHGCLLLDKLLSRHSLLSWRLRARCRLLLKLGWCRCCSHRYPRRWRLLGRRFRQTASPSPLCCDTTVLYFYVLYLVWCVPLSNLGTFRYLLPLRASIRLNIVQWDEVIFNHCARTLLEVLEVAERFVFRDATTPWPAWCLALIGHIVGGLLIVAQDDFGAGWDLRLETEPIIFVLLFTFTTGSTLFRRCPRLKRPKVTRVFSIRRGATL